MIRMWSGREVGRSISKAGGHDEQGGEVPVTARSAGEVGFILKSAGAAIGCPTLCILDSRVLAAMSGAKAGLDPQC